MVDGAVSKALSMLFRRKLRGIYLNGEPNVPDMIRTLDEHLRSRELAESAKRMQEKYRDLLKGHIIDSVEPDADGHRWFFLSDETEDPYIGPDGRVIESLKVEKRSSISLDEEVAEDRLKELGLLDQCIETVEVLDEDKILALNFEDKLSDEDLALMYKEGKATFAFKVNRGSKVDES